MAAAVAVMLGAHPRVRMFEAWVSAGVADTLGVLDADRLGTAVIFPIDGVLVDYEITAGCSVAFLLPPFFVVAAALIASGRIGIRAGLATLGVVTVALLAVNQLRLLGVALSMRNWGFETGYERSHILLGTLASTIGVVAGVVLFVFMLTRQPAPAVSHG
ncbi:hypothetical protein BH18ACT4_BH18ACT4_06610 [soil metagenome]